MQILNWIAANPFLTVILVLIVCSAVSGIVKIASGTCNCSCDCDEEDDDEDEDD